MVAKKNNGGIKERCPSAKKEGDFCGKHIKSGNKSNVGEKSHHVYQEIDIEAISKYENQGRAQSASEIVKNSKYAGASPIQHESKFTLVLEPFPNSKDIQIEKNTNYLFKKLPNKDYICIGKYNSLERRSVELTSQERNYVEQKEIVYKYSELPEEEDDHDEFAEIDNSRSFSFSKPSSNQRSVDLKEPKRSIFDKQDSSSERESRKSPMFKSNDLNKSIDMKKTIFFSKDDQKKSIFAASPEKTVAEKPKRPIFD